MHRLLTSAIPWVAVMTSTTGAHAERGEITEQSPYTLNPGEVRVGFSDVSIGLFGHDLLRRVEVGTRPIGWLPSLLGAPSYDVRGKIELWRDPHLSLSVAAQRLHVDLSRYAAERRTDFSVTSIEGWAGVRLGESWRLNGGVIVTTVTGSGEAAAEDRAELADLDHLGGELGTRSVQLRGNVDYKIFPAMHVVVGGRWVPWQHQWGAATARENLDDNGVDGGYVSNTTRGEGDLMHIGGRAWALGGELHFTWVHTNLRVGVEYGYYTVPIVNLVVSLRGVLPTLDLYWRI